MTTEHQSRQLGSDLNPILRTLYTHIFIIDPEFKISEKSPILPEIDVILHDISRIINPPHVKIYVANALNIFRKVMLNRQVERKNVLVNVYVIPYG